MREVCAVYANASNTGSRKEYFRYFLQDLSDSYTVYLGERTQEQSGHVWHAPQNYPIQDSDPSFKLFPYASYFYDNNVQSQFLGELTPAEQAIFSGLSPLIDTIVDRDMNGMIRSSIDYTNANGNYRATFFKTINNIAGINNKYSILCQANMVSETLTIGSEGPSGPIVTTNPEGPIVTEIETEVTGVETVKTNNVVKTIQEDEILQEIVQWISIEKPVTTKYTVNYLEITEYETSVEYHITYTEISTIEVIVQTQIKTVVMHTKSDNTNTVVSFQIVPVEPVVTPTPETPEEEEPEIGNENPVS